MNILILGSGGRESTLAWKLKKSNQLKQLYIAPGNAGTHEFGENVSLSITDFVAIKNFCIDKEIDILIPGGEDALVAGIYDYFKADEHLKKIIVVGPSKAGAQLEGSKAFSKKFMKKYGIPTADYREFDESTYDEGIQYINEHSLPIVLKADGLAAGKGVIIAATHNEALIAFQQMIKKQQFGAASTKVVIESFLDGIEVSVFVLTDGKNYLLLPEAKDYKRILEGDKGLNTGGMGAVSPVPFMNAQFQIKVIDDIIDPTIQGLLKEDIDYKGFIFFGLINVKGNPFVIEYNCRLGDPETEVVLPRINNDLIDLFSKIDKQQLSDVMVEIAPEAACTVMLVSKGYPEEYEKGFEIETYHGSENSIIFHAGTISKNGKPVTNGGRVMAITALADNLSDALNNAYEHVNKIQFEGKTYRTDIGNEFLK